MIVREAIATLDQVGHVHVITIEAGARECGRHFDFRVHALLAQDCDLRPRAGGDIGRGDIVFGIERYVGRQGMRSGDDRIALLVGATRIIATHLHRVADRMPDREHVRERLIGQDLTVTLHADTRVGARGRERTRDGREAMLRQHRLECGAIGVRNLHQHAEFFVEQRRQRIARHRDVETAAGREGHFAKRGEGTAIGAIVPGAQQRAQVDECLEEAPEQRGIVEVGRGLAELVETLRENRAAESLLASRQVEQPDRAGTEIAAQFGRQRLAHVGDPRERGHDQRHRRHHALFVLAIAENRLHRQRILADRDRQRQRRA